MSDLRLKGRVAIVTGAGGGIGKGIAELYAREGACVAIACRSDKGGAAAQAIRDAGFSAIWVQTDVSVSVDVQNLVGQVLAVYGRIDILVNNAAVQVIKPIWELEDEAFDRMLSTNLKGYFLCMKHVLPCMFDRKSGIIINVSSNLAFRALEGFAGYAATKGGIVAMSRTVAFEAAKKGVRVNCICPGSTITPIMEGLLAQYENPQDILAEAAAELPAGRLALPADIANLALFLATEDSAMVYGATYIMDGGASIHL